MGEAPGSPSSSTASPRSPSEVSSLSGRRSPARLKGAELGRLPTAEDARGVPLEPAEPSATARRTPGIWWWAAWLTLLVAWVPPLVAMHVADSSPAAKTGVGAALGTVAVLATLVFGARLGQRSAWREVWVASFVGAGEIAVALFC